MSGVREYDARGLRVDLPDERDAIKLAKTWANKLTETGKARAGTVVTVSDEYGNIVCKVPIPRKQ
jgi:hypothetical protein